MPGQRRAAPGLHQDRDAQAEEERRHHSARKSVILRILAERLAAQRDVIVGVLSRPQAAIHDFYRELGSLFGVQLSPHNRWAGCKVLRECWQNHIDSALVRPVLIVDEAQEMVPKVLAELRILASVKLDSHILLTVVPTSSPATRKCTTAGIASA